MTTRPRPFVLILLVVVLTQGYAQTQQRPRSIMKQQPPSDARLLVASEAAQARPSGQEPVTTRLLAGRSLVWRSPEPLKRVSVSDPAIASAVIVSPNQVLIHGLVPGTVTIILWNEREQTQTFELTVEIDLTGLQEMMTRVFPGETIQIGRADASVVLTGNVSSKEVADRAASLAQTRAKTVVNLLTPVQSVGEVLLQVRFAEVDRTAVQQLGVNIFSTGAANTPSAVSTGQFNAPQAGGPGGGGQGRVTGRIPGQIEGFESTFNFSDLLNIFVFRPDLNLGVTIRALEQRNVLQILAEPNLLALNGREANFLAGGEFPFPVIQAAGGFQAVTIIFKEFGVRLKFTPNILPDGTIRLKVAPEVSALDFSNALTISGFLIPALTTRRAETEIDLRDGQSFAIAGLIDNRLTEIASKIPGLGDIPIIGRLFKSRSTNRNNTELMVMVTPKLVRPLVPGQVPPMPQFPKPFIDKDKFDGKLGETVRKKN